MDNRTLRYQTVQGKNAQIPISPPLLKGLVFCGDCGHPLTRVKKVKNDGRYVYLTYQCTTHNTLMTCPRKYIHEEALNGAVYDAIRLEIQKAADVRGVIDRLNRESGHKTRLTRFDAAIDEAGREMKRIVSLRQAVYEDFAAGLINVSEYKFAAERYDQDSAKQQARLDKAKADKSAYTESATPANKWLAAFTRFTDGGGLTIEMANALIARVEVYDKDRVTVTFKFQDEYAAVCRYAEVTA